jgi:polyisoprenoid-binding protein YceI
LTISSIAHSPREANSTCPPSSPPQAFAPAGTWAADPVHSNVSFEVEYAGVNIFRGGFREFTPRSRASLEGSAKVASVDVKDEQLNGHLQTPDFFDAERFPEITFGRRAQPRRRRHRRAAQGRADDQGRHEARRAQGVDRRRAECRSVRPRAPRPRLETAIDRNEYGVSWNAPNQSGGNYLGDDVKLKADLAFVRQEG